MGLLSKLKGTASSTLVVKEYRICRQEPEEFPFTNYDDLCNRTLSRLGINESKIKSESKLKPKSFLDTEFMVEFAQNIRSFLKKSKKKTIQDDSALFFDVYRLFIKRLFILEERDKKKAKTRDSWEAYKTLNEILEYFYKEFIQRDGIDKELEISNGLQLERIYQRETASKLVAGLKQYSNGEITCKTLYAAFDEYNSRDLRLLAQSLTMMDKYFECFNPPKIDRNYKIDKDENLKIAHQILLNLRQPIELKFLSLFNEYDLILIFARKHFITIDNDGFLWELLRVLEKLIGLGEKIEIDNRPLRFARGYKNWLSILLEKIEKITERKEGGDNLNLVRNIMKFFEIIPPKPDDWKELIGNDSKLVGRLEKFVDLFSGKFKELPKESKTIKSS